MVSKALPHGARVYSFDDGVILVKQTLKRTGTSRYVIDTLADGTHRERHLDPGDDLALGAAVRLAVSGKL